MNESFSVMKFGGTSVDNAPEVSAIADQESQFAKPVLAVSAYSGQTNVLLGIADTICERRESDANFHVLFDPVIEHTLAKAKEQLAGAAHSELMNDIEHYCYQYIANLRRVFGSISSQYSGQDLPSNVRTYIVDKIVGIGENFSAHVLAPVLTARSQVGLVFQDVTLDDILPYSFDAPFIRRDQKPALYREIADAIWAKLSEIFLRGKAPVVTGYFGFVPGGILDTIDRGYTDPLAALIALSLSRSGVLDENILLQIWKEVPGLLSGDPRKVEVGYDPKTYRKASDFKYARVMSHVSRREVAELSGLGGMKAVNANVMNILKGTKILAQVRNTFDPKSPGTTITAEEDQSSRGIRFIAGRAGNDVLRVSGDDFPDATGVLADIYEYAKRLAISVDATTSGEASVSFSVNSTHSRLGELLDHLRSVGDVDTFKNMAILCCIGNDMKERIGVLALITTILAANGIALQFDCGDPDSNVSVLIPEKDLDKGIRVLHREIIEKGQQSIMDVPGYEALRRSLTSDLAPAVSKEGAGI